MSSAVVIRLLKGCEDAELMELSNPILSHFIELELGSEGRPEERRGGGPQLQERIQRMAPTKRPTESKCKR